ncbi:MAG TPA: MFS transporter [candidate division WOR-3 bacterium]|uniref:MFS transporter n=1 Tax=candidate division WOR-3 bacterium TaxID=2052148 RepID=A0A7V0XE77_UNCW3|nr:MFS transporter [candidate division WOR-3 bacterium]
MPTSRPDRPAGQQLTGNSGKPARNVLVTGVTSFLNDISSEMTYPLIPLFLTALGAPAAALGAIEGLAESTAALLKTFSGWWSDRVGRRKPLAIGGYAGSSLGKLLLYAATGWPLVLAGRLTDRIGKGIRTAPRDALIADSTPEGSRGRAFGLHRAMDTIGAAVGVLFAILFLRRFGTGLDPSGYRPVFLIALIPALAGTAVLLLIREPKVCHTRRNLPRLSLSGLPLRLKLFLLVIGLFALGNSSNMFLLLRAGNLGFSPVGVLVLYLVFNLTYGLLSYPAGRLSDRVGRKRLLITGYLLYGAVYIGFALAPSGQWAWPLFTVYGLFYALTEGLEKALVADIAPVERRATFVGLHSTLVGIGLLPASLIAGALWAGLGPAATFWFGGALGIAAALGLLIVL